MFKLVCCIIGIHFWCVLCQEPYDAVTGLSIKIECNHEQLEGAPFWFINDTVYELFSIPQYLPSIPLVDSYTRLTIPSVTRSVNNTVFICVTLDGNGSLISPNSIQLIVTSGKNPGSISQRPDNILSIDYQRLRMYNNKTKLEWTLKNRVNCNGTVELQGHTIMNGTVAISTSNVIRVKNGHIGEIPTCQLSTSGDPLYYRLVAFDENGSICSDATSQDTYYRFEGNYQTSMLSPNSSTICFDVMTEIDACPTSLYFIWPQRQEGLSCLCPVYNSSDGRSVFEACTQGCKSDFVPLLTEDGQVCLNSTVNGVLFNFMCSTNPCTENCFTKTILSSHLVLLSEEDIVLINVNNGAELHCDLQAWMNLTLWSLNDTSIYNLTSLQELIPSLSAVNNTLRIPRLPPALNNTRFQCGVFIGEYFLRGPQKFRLITSEQLQTQGAVTGFSTSIPCDHGRQEEAPFWFINNIVYELFSIPENFLSIPVVTSYTSLNIPNVTKSVDNTVFRCATFDRNGYLTSSANAIRLVVADGSNPGSVSQEASNVLLIDYQRLDVQENGTMIEWNLRNSINCDSIQLEGYTIMNSHATVVMNSTTQLFISESQLYYRLVAVYENGSICSDATSQKTYYRFEGISQNRSFSPNSPTTMCFNSVTERGACTASLYFIWPQGQEGLSCLCPVFDSDDGQSVFDSCVRGCDTDIMPHLNEDGQVCLTGLRSSMDGTKFHFMCSTDPCTENCFLKTILSSHTLTYLDEDLILNADNVTELSCNLQNGTELPFWFLNDTLYTLTSLQQVIPSFSSVNNTLIIFGPPPSLDNTRFQCGLFIGDSLVLGNVTYNLIVPALSLDAPEPNSIIFNYQELEITSVSIHIGWIPNQICSELYRVVEFDLNGNMISENMMLETSPNATIPVNDRTTTTLFGIVAVYENQTVCSSNNRRYKFAATKFQPVHEMPDGKVCLPIPEDQSCDSIEVVWQEICSLPIKAIINNTRNHCGNSTDLQYDNETICFSNVTDKFIHFQCSERDNTNSELHIITILSSYKIVTPQEDGPPNITINNNYCFSIMSSIEVVINYTISSSGIPDNSSATQTSTLCFNDTFPDKCREFNVTVEATNEAGTTQETQNFTSMSCYQSSSITEIIVIVVSISVITLVIIVVVIIFSCCYCYHKKRREYKLPRGKTPPSINNDSAD